MTDSELLFGAWAFDRCRCCLNLYQFELRRYCRRCGDAACYSCTTQVGPDWVCATCRDVPGIRLPSAPKTPTISPGI